MGIEDEILILSGTANPQLSEDVVKNLGLKLGNMEIRKFADGSEYSEAVQFIYIQKNALRSCLSR